MAEPKKLNDYSYIVEKEGSMKVPLKIFASEKLMEQLKKDKSIQQGMNVATLPGIKGMSIMMPDAHQGYGFSIGGVAALDINEGCISPGGIGFDINCLTRDSKVLSEHGYFKPIQDFEQNFTEVENAHPEYSLKSMKNTQSLVSFDHQQKCFSSKRAHYFMKRKHSGSVMQIKTKLGCTIHVTEEHPILTKEGMIEAGKLYRGQSVAAHPFAGVEYEEITEDKILIDETAFTKQEKDELRKRNLLQLNLKHPKLPIITKLFGYLLGDGSVYFSGKKGYVNAYGPKEDLKEIQKDLAELGFSAKIYSRNRNHKIHTKYGEVRFSNTTHELHTPSKSLARLFFELEYPKGNKTTTPFLVPEWIMNSPLWMKRLFLSGLFGAELTSPKTITKTGFSCPVLSMNKNRSVIESGREFAIQIMTLLEEFDVDTLELLHREDYFNKHGPTDRLKLSIKSEENNLLKLWSNIGFSYNKKRHLLSQIAILYIKEKKLLAKKRTKVAAKTKELKKKGITLKEAQKLLGSPITNKRFIERHYYENAGQRITLSFPSFKEFIEFKTKELEEHGCLFDKIESISKENYEDFVYDFNIPETHNFIADNIVVSNCGVRLLKTNLNKEEVYNKIKDLLENIFNQIPAGVGGKSKLRLDDDQLKAVLETGVKWCVDNGHGTEDDMEHCESNGQLEGAHASKVSTKAKSRGRAQLGTLGAGNHFLEIQYVDEIYDEEIAKQFGIEKDSITIMIHCGSRGLGHQVCSDYLRKMEDTYPDIMKSLPEKDLIYAPAGSELAKDYFAGMASAANFAWANRHIIGNEVRKAVKKTFPDSDLKTIYDVAHNIAKIEEHEYEGEKFKAYVHRKGATRAFPPGHPDIPKAYQETGQPIFIPGSMGTASYILVGTEKGMKESFGSTAHGAGRVMSRHEATSKFRGEEIKRQLKHKNIYVKAASWKGISEEAPQAYKDVDEVVKVSHEAGLGKLVARLRPIGVVKG